MESICMKALELVTLIAAKSGELIVGLWDAIKNVVIS